MTPTVDNCHYRDDKKDGYFKSEKETGNLSGNRHSPDHQHHCQNCQDDRQYAPRYIPLKLVT